MEDLERSIRFILHAGKLIPTHDKKVAELVNLFNEQITRETEALKNYIIEYHKNMYKELTKDRDNEYVKGGVRVLTLISRKLHDLE